VRTIVEVEARLRVHGMHNLTSLGYGVIGFTTDNANQRWVVNHVHVYSDQDATARIQPRVEIAINSPISTLVSRGNSRGATLMQAGIADWDGEVEVGPCDEFDVVFNPPTGFGGSFPTGVTVFATVIGRKYTRRA
jgi:hypothetical protein